MLTLLGVLLISIGTYTLINSVNSLRAIYRICRKNKDLYLSALEELLNRAEHLVESIPETEIDELKFITFQDLLRQRNSRAILVAQIYSLIAAVSADVDEMKKCKWFIYDPQKLFYEKYKKVFEQLPQLKEEI